MTVPARPLPEFSRYDRIDELRLLGLSRIPRCSHCPRLAALERAFATRSAIDPDRPGPVQECRDPICDPLVRRYSLLAH